MKDFGFEKFQKLQNDPPLQCYNQTPNSNITFQCRADFNKNSDDHEFTDTSQNRNKIVLKKFKFVNRKGKKNLKTQAK